MAMKYDRMVLKEAEGAFQRALAGAGKEAVQSRLVVIAADTAKMEQGQKMERWLREDFKDPQANNASFRGSIFSLVGGITALGCNTARCV